MVDDRSRIDTFVIVILILLAAFLCVACFLVATENENLRIAAIERGYAMHCPDDGRFAWVGECRE